MEIKNKINNYRPDVDGMRALAVLSVVFFHAFPEMLPGGFVGVDIFFVISGYLITQIICKKLVLKNFSYKDFFVHRITRIFPSLIVVLATSLIVGYFILLPDEYKQLGKHVFSGAAFVSNFVLWKESGYWDVAAETKPMLHLWSLSVEEQFYIVWPILLGCLYRRKIGFKKIISVVAIISFAANLFLVNESQSADFFFPISRFWELLCGGFVGLMVLNENGGIKVNIELKNDLKSKNKRLLSVAGLIFISFSVFIIDAKDGYPGYWAIMPVLGGALIIYAGKDSIVNRYILSNRFLVSLGLFSYPIYLWHWPILSFARIVESQTPAMEIRIIAIILSMILGWATYEYVEKYIRFGNCNKIKSSVVLICLLVTIGAMGYYVFINDGFPERFL